MGMHSTVLSSGEVRQPHPEVGVFYYNDVSPVGLLSLILSSTLAGLSSVS